MPLKSQESRANFVHSNWDVKPDETHLLIRAELVVINFFKKYWFSIQEEELRARKREQLMQQSRREAQLSRLRFEEERMKVRDSIV